MLQMLGFYKNQKKIITQTSQSANISTCQYWTSVESLHLAKFKVLPSFQTFYEYFKRFSARLWKNSLPWNSLASSTSASLSSTPDDSNDTTNNFIIINTWWGTVTHIVQKYFWNIILLSNKCRQNVKADECFELLLHIFCKHYHSMKFTPLHTQNESVNKYLQTSKFIRERLNRFPNDHGAITLSHIYERSSIYHKDLTVMLLLNSPQCVIRLSLICCLSII